MQAKQPGMAAPHAHEPAAPARQQGCRAVLLLGLSLLSLTAQAASLTRISSFEYDASGLIVKEIIEPDNSALCLVTTHAYDSWGNRTSSSTRNCNGSSGEAAAPTGDPVFEARSSSTGYDATGRYATSSTNALNHTETRTADLRFGVALSLTGPNGLTTSWQYDSFGRKTRETRADGTYTEMQYLYCAGVNGGTESCPTIAGAVGKTLVRTLVKDSAGNLIAPTSVSYMDGLGRTIRNQTVGGNGSQLIYQDTEYNALGQVARASRPYFAGTETPVWVSYQYDPLGRVTQETAPNGLITTNNYNGLEGTTTIYPGAGRDPQSKRTVKNVAGQIAAVYDSDNNVLQHQYDAAGNLSATIDALGNTTTLSYDTRGRKISMLDPDMGSWSYAYNALGELIRQTDAKAQVTTLSYDKLGRMTQRAEGSLISTWTYDACTKGIGKLCSVTGDNGYTRSHSYDSLGRSSTTTTTIDQAYTATTSYDSAGRTDLTTYPTGFAVRSEYDSLGRLYQLKRTDTNAVLWQLNTRDARGQTITETLGNGITNSYLYDTYSGRINSVGTSAGGVFSQNYAYDLMGNLMQRLDNVTGVSEYFAYDKLNRLTQTSGSGQVTRSFSYNVIGNILTKSDIGSYAYNPSGASSIRPHAVTATTGGAANTNATYQYDANGNLTQVAYANGNSRSLSYTGFNLPSQITATQGGQSYTYQYHYGPDHERVRHIITRPDGTHTTIYLHSNNAGGLFYEKETKASGVVEHKHYVAGLGMYVTKSSYGVGDGPQMRYYHKDHQGTVFAITNDSGVVIERLAFEAFGERRYPNGTAQNRDSPIIGLSTDRGYTGHEHLDELNLIHMNGRIYDPALARFLTPDPHIDGLYELQGYNRYSYVANNPLNFTDPTGYKKFWKSWTARNIMQTTLRSAIFGPIGLFPGPGRTIDRFVARNSWAQSAVMFSSVACGPWAAACAAGNSAYITLASGGRMQDAARAAAITYLTAQAYNAVGTYTNGHGVGMEYFGTTDHMLNIAGHALVGCASAAASGGSCGSGAAGAAAGSFAAPFQPGIVGSALIGGAVADATGGDFGQGAGQAAMGHIFNWLNMIGKSELQAAALGIKPTGAYAGKDFIRGLFFNFEGGGGGLMGAGVGLSQETTVAIDNRGKMCVVSTTCGLAGPFAASGVYATGSVGTGNVTPGESVWKFGVFGTFAEGAGVLGNFQYVSNGNVQYGYNVFGGAAAGGGVMVCRQNTSAVCN